MNSSNSILLKNFNTIISANEKGLIKDNKSYLYLEDEIIKSLREKIGPDKMIWTPGVNISTGDGEMGQRYGDPREAVLAGSDCIIVGSGIHKSDNPKEAAKAYAEKSWNALFERVV